jgi:CHAT domain
MSAAISCQLVEFHRFGGPHTVFLSPDNAYIRAAGWDEPVAVVRPALDQEGFLRLLNQLRYSHSDGQDPSAARIELGAQAIAFLPAAVLVGDLVQLDLVTNAAELWAFPFEACYAARQEWLTDAARGVVLTRRIRSGFSDEVLPWPERPRVLFAHAPTAPDLEAELVAAHAVALKSALSPWAAGPGTESQLLAVSEVCSVDELIAARNAFKPSYVHLLAHGAPTRPDPLLPDRTVWGLRFGYPGEAGVPPAAIAEALAPTDGVPLVVTVAACDSANQAQILYSSCSVVQELHRLGVPVVVGSQLPLTKAGSVTLARKFYEHLLRGDDVRLALQAARVALHQSSDAGADWLGLVSYVRIPPEGYAQHLVAFGLRAELRMLDAAQKRADALSVKGGSKAEFDEVETLIRARIASLDDRRQKLDPGRRELLDECRGLLASAYKRLAELLFVRSRTPSEQRQADLRASRQALAESLACYRSAYRASLQSHWVGIQQLALEAALTGKVSKPADWSLVLRVAEFERDRNEGDYWACGTIAEAHLLAPLAGAPAEIDAAGAALALLRHRADKDSEKGSFAIESTRRQLRRYVSWWTNANGFFPGGPDLATDAEQLAELLE